jgi:hypothetical protein
MLRNWFLSCVVNLLCSRCCPSDRISQACFNEEGAASLPAAVAAATGPVLRLRAGAEEAGSNLMAEAEAAGTGAAAAGGDGQGEATAQLLPRAAGEGEGSGAAEEVIPRTIKLAKYLLQTKKNC